MKYLLRIARYDTRDGLNAFTVFNQSVLDEARASDERRASGLLPRRPLEGIPYTLKDSYKYAGMTVTNGAPALEGLMSSEDSYVASCLREAGAVMIGKTNMPPMAAGGMQRGLYGRAESPYNREYLTAAFSSGSSNGAATATAASFAVFGMGSETVSSGRSAASNNALVAYTPSRGIISCRGLWPLYVTCDDPVPYARSVSDMLEILDVITKPDSVTAGDFWRDQPYVTLPPIPKIEYKALINGDGARSSLAGKRVAVPKMYIGEKDSHPGAKPTVSHPATIELWNEARRTLEALGATVVPTDFPLVTNYEDDRVSGEANNVTGAPEWWNNFERSALCAKAWDEFLIANKDARLADLTKIENSAYLFPKPNGYVPDIFVERKNLIDYAGLPELARQRKGTALYDLPGMKEALPALEAQRRRDLEDWMEANDFACVVFPAAGDVGKADLEFDVESARHALQNGVKYSHGNRAIRHLGVPTISVPMGLRSDIKMPVNLTFAGKAYDDAALLKYAYAFETKSRARVAPPLTPALKTDLVSQKSSSRGEGAQKSRSGKDGAKRGQISLSASAQKGTEAGKTVITVSGSIKADVLPSTIEVYLEGSLAGTAEISPNTDGRWEVKGVYTPHQATRLSWNLEPLPPSPIMVLVVASCEGTSTAAELMWL